MQDIILKPIFRGDKKIIPLLVTDKNNNPLSLVDRTFYFTVKKDDNDSYVNAYIKKVELITNTQDHIDGKYTLVLSSEDTRLEPGEYKYDCRISEVGVADSIEITYQGTFVILRTITDIV